MAGHSKWANIRFRKMGQDARRGKLFTKYIREITVSAQQGGPDPQSNPRLRAAIDKALTANMTRDTIDRAIKRGAGGLEGQDVEEIRYEGYGPGGVAIMVDCMTNNRNRTVGEVRHAFTKLGGNLGTEGSVGYLFNKQGQIVFGPGTSEDKVMEIALESGAQDVQVEEDGSIIVITAFEDFAAVRQAVEKANLKPERAEMTSLPINYVSIDDKDIAIKFNKLIDTLEDLDDVQAVFSNGDIAETLFAELGYST
jgi:YebC/PmpR family DNA-binding regulatory protein